MDTNIIWYVADGIVIFMSETACRAYCRVYMLGSVNDAVIKCLPLLLRGYSLHDCVGNDRCGVVTYHAASVARACPLRKELVLTCDVCHTELDLLVYGRVYEIEQREQCSECIPESCICVKVTVADLSVVWAVVYRLASFIEFVELAWEEGCAVQA